ncbi:MAG: hypothetical protein ABSE82_15615, partial [Nitrososphaerales archaeon]
TLPEAGSTAYNQFLEQINQFETVLKDARANGKNVFYHSEFGQDRTGLFRALDEVINQNKSIEEALADWRNLKQGAYDKSFMDLYNEDSFRKLVADYQAKYGSEPRP